MGVPTARLSTIAIYASSGKCSIKPSSGDTKVSGKPLMHQCTNAFPSTMAYIDSPDARHCSNEPSSTSARYNESSDNSVANSAATQITPPAILDKNVGSGSTAKGNKAATIKKNINGLAHSPGLRAAKIKSRLTVAITKLIPPLLRLIDADRESPQVRGDW